MALTELVKLKLNQSRQFRKAGNFRAAENELEEALAIYPEHTVLLEALGQLYLHAGRLSEAAALAEELYQRHLGSAGPIKLRGEVLLRQGRPKEALEMFLEADRQVPSDYTKALIVRALTRAKEHEEAVRRGEEAAAAYPESTHVLSALEAAYAAAGHPERAAETCQRLLQLKPQDEYATRDLIKNRLATLPAEEAASELEALLRVPSYGRNPHIQKLAGEHYFRAGNYEAAARCYKAAMAAEPSDRHALQQLGFSLYRMGNYLETISILEPFFLDDPLNVYVRNAVIGSYKKLEMVTELVQLFEKALAAHPEAKQLYGIRKKTLKSLGSS